jgi:hypothetical protein
MQGSPAVPLWKINTIEGELDTNPPVAYRIERLFELRREGCQTLRDHKLRFVVLLFPSARAMSMLYARGRSA